MDRREWLAREFEEQRPHLRAVAYRMPGSLTEAEDAIQASWLRLERTDGTIDDSARGSRPSSAGSVWICFVLSCRAAPRSRRSLDPAMVDGSVGAIVDDPRRPIAVV